MVELRMNRLSAREPNGIPSKHYQGTVAAHTTLWQNGDFVKSMVDNNFYEGTNQWNNVNTHDITQNYSQNDYVHLNTLSKKFLSGQGSLG